MKIREVSVQQINAALNDLTRDIDIKIKQIESLNNEIKNMQSKLEALTKAVNGDFTALDEAIGDNIEYINNNFVPNTRTVNGKALNQNISLTASDVGALPDSTVIPAAQVNSDWNATSGVAEILNKPSLATVATSGSYSDLSNKPTIPTVVNSVASGNMNAVTSNAVAGALNPLHIAKNGSIYADGTKANVPIIKMKDNTSDANGNGIVIGGGGATVIGGGESANTYYSGAGLSAGNERMVVANDGNIDFVSNLDGGYANGKTMTFNTSGNLSIPSSFTTSLDNKGSWWTSTAPKGKFVGTNGGNSNSWSPLLAGKTVSGKYEFGSLNNTVYLNYYKDSRTTNGVDKNIFSYTDGQQPIWYGVANHIPTSKADDSPGAIWIA